MEEDFLEFVNYVADDIYVPIPRNLIRDNLNPLVRYTNDELVRRFRFSGQIILHVICPLVYPLQGNPDNRGSPIPNIVKLCVALRCFASGSYQRVNGDVVKISQATVSRVIAEVSNRLARTLQRFVGFPQGRHALSTTRQLFYNIAQFPGVVGCVDGTHAEIKNPGGGNGEIYRNRKGWMSLNIQVVAAPQNEIFDIVIRWPGSSHNSRIFNSSSVYLRLVQGDLPGILLGDSAYGQTRYMYTPILNAANRAEQRYNTAHIRTRNVVERTFGIWKGRFRCLVIAFQLELMNTTKVIAATAVSHNIAIRHRQQFQEADFYHDPHNMLAIEIPANMRGMPVEMPLFKGIFCSSSRTLFHHFCAYGTIV